MKQPVYLDNNATTPVDERVLQEMLPYFTRNFGNAASRTHVYGWIAEEAVDHARERVATLINAHPKEIVFTSGATESVNLAIKGVYEAYSSKGNRIITCVTEHKAVLDTCRHLEKFGAEITYLPVKEDGRINAEILEKSIQSSTILIAVMYANNEIGVIQPVQEIAAIARKHNVLFFCDTAQAAGKIPVDVINDDIPLLSLSAHKMYGPKGIGALYVRRKDPRVKLIAQMDGGGHENNMRSGTLNVPGIVGFGKACEICMSEMDSEAKRLSALRDKLETALVALNNVSINGSTEHRLPHVTNLSFEGATANTLISALHKSVAVSSGSACTSALVEPSYVLKALGLSDERANASLRFGLGRFTSEEDIGMAIEAITGSIKNLRSQSVIN
ncbi:MAG TPA: aminotransferase class V-fold PLP-dependent enzyme [Chitinophagaceae bacterium]|nr:aminotransferase class V-fold PLP-dependent enzyme [Chitinophagaceae bacterium]